MYIVDIFIILNQTISFKQQTSPFHVKLKQQLYYTTYTAETLFHMKQIFNNRNQAQIQLPKQIYNNATNSIIVSHETLTTAKPSKKHFCFM